MVSGVGFEPTPTIVVDSDKVMAGAERAKSKQKENYDVKAHSLTPLEVGEFVRLKLPDCYK